MAKIKCANCGAMNQDVEATDLCWQCDFALDAPKVDEVDATQPVIHTEAPPTLATAQIQQPAPLANKPLPEAVPTPTQVPATSPTKRTFPVATLVAVLVFLILVVVLLLKNR